MNRVTSNKFLYIISLNHLVNDSSTYLLSSLFPAVVLAFGFSTFQIGILVALGYLVNMIFQPITGRLSEHNEARKLLAIGISLLALSMFLFTVSTTFISMILSVLVMRLGSSFYHPVGVSAISKSYFGEKLDSSMGFQSSFGNLGIALAFVASGPLYLALSWRGPFLIYAALEIGTVMVTLFGMRERKTSKDAIDSTKLSQDEPDKNWPIRNSLKSSQTNRKVARQSFGIPLFFVFSALVTGGVNALFGNFGNLLLYHNGFNLSSADYLMATWVLSAFFGAISSGWLALRLTRIKLLGIMYFISGLASLGFAFSSNDVVLVSTSLVASGFALSITYPLIYSELSAYVSYRSSQGGTAFGILFSSQIGGSSLLGFVSGFLAERFGLEIPFEVSSVLLISSVIILIGWVGGKRNTFLRK